MLAARKTWSIRCWRKGTLRQLRHTRITFVAVVERVLLTRLVALPLRLMLLGFTPIGSIILLLPPQPQPQLRHLLRPLLRHLPVLLKTTTTTGLKVSSSVKREQASRRCSGRSSPGSLTTRNPQGWLDLPSLTTDLHVFLDHSKDRVHRGRTELEVPVLRALHQALLDQVLTALLR